MHGWILSGHASYSIPKWDPSLLLVCIWRTITNHTYSLSAACAQPHMRGEVNSQRSYGCCPYHVSVICFTRLQNLLQLLQSGNKPLKRISSHSYPYSHSWPGNNWFQSQIFTKLLLCVRHCVKNLKEYTNIKYGSFVSRVCNTTWRTNYSRHSLLSHSPPLTFQTVGLVKEFLFVRGRISHKEAQVERKLCQQFPMEPISRKYC